MRVRILRPLGECSVGEHLAGSLDGWFIEGRITFLARTPAGGWIVTFDSDVATWEVYCANGVCTLVSRLAEEDWTFAPAQRPVADTRTGRRYSLSG